MSIKTRDIDFSDEKAVVDIVTNDRVEPAHYCLFLNPHAIVEGAKRSDYKKLLDRSDCLKFADGIGIKLKQPYAKRFTGRDFTLLLYSLMPIKTRFLWLGGESGQEQLFLRSLAKFGIDASNTRVQSLPYKSTFDKIDITCINNIISNFKPNVIFVCVGAPKQEILMSQLSLCDDTKLIAGVGAVYDFVLNPDLDAHPVLRFLGLEWLYRLITNPKKTWKRTLISLPKFIFYH